MAKHRPKHAARLDREIAGFLARPRPNHATKHADVFDLAVADEYGVRFETGVPVTFHFIRNTEKSPKLGKTFGQDIEPHGRYFLHNHDPDRTPPSGWQTGTVTFRSPLVIKLSGDPDEIYGSTGWKARLHGTTGKKGAALSRHLAKTYDGIVTVDDQGDTREIVDLSRFRP
jgi:hypothetical protein